MGCRTSFLPQDEFGNWAISEIAEMGRRKEENEQLREEKVVRLIEKSKVDG